VTYPGADICGVASPVLATLTGSVRTSRFIHWGYLDNGVLTRIFGPNKEEGTNLLRKGKVF
jgi:hypothetical protein